MANFEGRRCRIFSLFFESQRQMSTMGLRWDLLDISEYLPEPTDEMRTIFVDPLTLHLFRGHRLVFEVRGDGPMAQIVGVTLTCPPEADAEAHWRAFEGRFQCSLASVLAAAPLALGPPAAADAPPRLALGPPAAADPEPAAPRAV